MVPDAPPPHRLVSSTAISTAAAATMLQSYMALSEAHPHLHPDALITPTGVTFSSHGGPMGGVVMHNLRRIAAGLRGEYLEPEPTPEPEGTFAGETGKKTTFSDEQVEWQDKEVYEQEQGVDELGELGERTNVVAVGGEEPIVEGTAKRGGEVLDKEARKRAKKERDAVRKRDKEQSRRDA